MTSLAIAGLTPFTMLDFPERTACIVWCAGCNLRCPYCHNPDLVCGKKRTHDACDALAFLRRRQGLLDGVVLSGGEATLHGGLADFIAEVRTLGYAVKLDTNGTRPAVVRDLLDRQHVDYIALDYKAPCAKSATLTGRDDVHTPFHETLRLLCAQSRVPFEVRTTVHTALLDEEDIDAIMDDLEAVGYRGTYYVQNFRADNNRPTLGNLTAQSRTLEHTRLKKSCYFAVDFRNF